MLRKAEKRDRIAPELLTGCRKIITFAPEKSDIMKGVLFDMDGVLVDNMDAHTEAFRLFCMRYAVDDWQERLTPALYGRGNDEIMRAVLPERIVAERGIAALGAEKEAIYREVYASRIAPTAGLVTFLRDLTQNGIRCAVGSSGCRANVDFVLERCGIAPYFSATVCGDEVTRCKPDPEIYLKAAGALGLEPSECLVFEDAPSGIEAARRAGMKAIALTTSFARRDLEAARAFRIIGDFTEIAADEISSLC